MNTIVLLSALPILSAFAAVGPLEPAPGNVYKPGSDCAISWSKDTSGKWTEMNIELMTGSNEDMTHLTTVTTIDGTQETSFTFDCPEVSPNAAIYFYQFSAASDPTDLMWTGRFAISDDSGKTTDPTEDDNGIKWGKGSLVDASKATPAPSYLVQSSGSSSSSATTGSSTGNSTSTIGSGSSVTSSKSALGALTATGTLSTTLITTAVPQTSKTGSGSNAASTASASSTGGSSSSNSSGAASLIVDIQARGLQALAGIVGTAFVFGTLL